MRLHGDRAVGRNLQSRSCVSWPTAGAISRPAYMLRARRRQPSHQGSDPVGLAFYGDEDKFAGWAAARRRQAFLLSGLYRVTRTRTRPCKACSTSAAFPMSEPAARPGPGRWPSWRAAASTCMRFLLHAAWRPDPLKQALSMIPVTRLFVIKRAHERSPAPGTFGHLRRPRHQALRD